MLRNVRWSKIIALSVAFALPVSASAGPLREAAEKAGRELGVAQSEQSVRSRGRFWTSVALIAGGAVLALLGSIELADSDSGSNEGNDTDDAAGVDDGDSREKVMLGGGIAAAGVGAILLMTGRRTASPAISTRPGRVTVSHTIRF
jgi:hypothetical protein